MAYPIQKQSLGHMALMSHNDSSSFISGQCINPSQTSMNERQRLSVAHQKNPSHLNSEQPSSSSPKGQSGSESHKCRIGMQ